MLVILDRDGVINEDSVHYIKSPNEWQAIPGSLEAIAKLNHQGHRVAIATNQSGIARGYFDKATLEAIHQKMLQELALLGGHIDLIVYCPHGPDDGCGCRKPKSGMLLEIANQLDEDLSQSVLIGDALRDIQAAKTVHCRAILVKTGKGEQTLKQGGEALQDIDVFNDLAQVVSDGIASE